MTITFSIVHRTEYRYGAPMNDGYTVAYLLPRDTPNQRVVSADVHVTPDADEYEERVDMFGNRVVRLGVHRQHDHLGVVGRCVVDVDVPANSPSGGLPWNAVVVAVSDARGDRAVDVAAFAAPTDATPPVPALDRMLDDLFHPGRPLVDVVRAVSSRINAEFLFDPEFSTVSTPITDVLTARRGVCQDFAHLMLAALRSRGLAARYVSGYIETEPPPGMDKLIGSDASHAWCSVWTPDMGWLDADPTNDQVPPRRHVTVAWGRDYFDVTPVRGVVIGPSAMQTLNVGVDVTTSDRR
jgi:transglutaminase-like putative cysteine protease